MSYKKLKHIITKELEKLKINTSMEWERKSLQEVKLYQKVEDLIQGN